MMNTDPMESLHKALNSRVNAACPVQFWLRDDDAVEPSKALDRLLKLTERYAVPVTLAVIPALTGDALGLRLASASSAAVAVHGWSHQNYAPATEKKQEFGLHRPVSEVVAELARGYSELKQRHTRQFVPLLVPPWNRIDDAIVQELPSIGFKGLSTFGAQRSDVIPTMNTHVDVIDWKGSRGGRMTRDLVMEMVALIESTRSPIGILSHHLVHDNNAWHFLEQLFATTSVHAGANWVPINTLLPALSPNPRLPSQ